MGALSRLPIHPFVFSALFVVASLWISRFSVLPEEGLFPLLVMEAGCLLFLLLSYLFVKDLVKASLITSLAVILFCIYRAFSHGVDTWLINLGFHPLPSAVLLALYLLISFAVVRALLQDSWKLGSRTVTVPLLDVHNNLNIISLILLVLNTAPLLAYEQHMNVLRLKLVRHFQEQFCSTSLLKKQPQRDIYYIIMDAYAHNLTLKEQFDYDNSEFLHQLEQLGFRVIDQSFSTYDRTYLSIASTLNMSYLDYVKESLADDLQDETVYHKLIENNMVQYLLDKVGYNFVNVSSGASGTDFCESTKFNLKSTPVTHFGLFLLILTPVSALEPYFSPISNLLMQIRNYPSRAIDELQKIPAPRFVLIHSDITHPPCLVDEAGKPVPFAVHKGLYNSDEQDYIVQAKYGDKEVIRWVRQILARPGVKPIIIIQSDHGAFYPRVDLALYYNERMRIINAVYFPGILPEQLPRRMSSVNTFRYLLNLYFGANLSILPDRALCPRQATDNNDWQDVTDCLRFSPSN